MDNIIDYDKSIAEMFKDKNNRIFIENLQRNINDNHSSLMVSIENKIKLVSLDIMRRVNDIVKYGDIDYDLKSLSAIFDKCQQLLLEHFKSTVESRKEKLDKATEDDEFSFSDFLKLIDEFLINNKEGLERGINEIIYEKLESELFDFFPNFKSEEQKQRVINALKMFDFKVTKTIEDLILERDMSLKNVTQETYTKVEELKKKVPEITEKTKSISKAA